MPLIWQREKLKHKEVVIYVQSYLLSSAEQELESNTLHSLYLLLVLGLKSILLLADDAVRKLAFIYFIIKTVCRSQCCHVGLFMPGGGTDPPRHSPSSWHIDILEGRIAGCVFCRWEGESPWRLSDLSKDIQRKQDGCTVSSLPPFLPGHRYLTTPLLNGKSSPKNSQYFIWKAWASGLHHSVLGESVSWPQGLRSLGASEPVVR